MRRLICAFFVCIWHKQVFSWCGSFIPVFSMILISAFSSSPSFFSCFSGATTAFFPSALSPLDELSTLFDFFCFTTSVASPASSECFLFWLEASVVSADSVECLLCFVTPAESTAVASPEVFLCFPESLDLVFSEWLRFLLTLLVLSDLSCLSGLSCLSCLPDFSCFCLCFSLAGGWGSEEFIDWSFFNKLWSLKTKVLFSQITLNVLLTPYQSPRWFLVWRLLR